MLLYMSQWNTSNINEFPNDNIMFKFCSDVWYQRCQKELIPVLYWGVIPRQSSKLGNWGGGGGIKGDMGRVILIEITAPQSSKGQSTLQNFLFSSFWKYNIFCYGSSMNQVFYYESGV